MKESLGFKTEWVLKKYNTEKCWIKGDAYETNVILGNLALNTGLNLLWTLLCSASGTNFSHDNAELGVGDSATAAAVEQTDLQASTNKAWLGMDSSYPTYGTDQKATWKATFDGDTGNFSWNEFAIRNSDSVLFNRKVSAQGTKASGQVWELTLTIYAS